MNRTKRILDYYEHRIVKGRPGFEVLDWASEKTQQMRFAVLADNVNLVGRKILDVGCGLGDLWTFLKRRGVKVHYTGVDLVGKMAAAAGKLHTDGRFLKADIFKEDTFAPGDFNVVFCSGALNLNLGNNRSFLPEAVGRMLRLCDECVVLNLLHARARGADPTYFYFDPDDVIDLLKPLPCGVRIIDDYLPNDFTVICQRDE